MKKKKAFLIRSGSCKPHVTDFDLIKTYLRNNGWTFSKKIDNADIIIINTCAFIKEKEDASIELIRKIQKEKSNNTHVIITGCLPAINEVRLRQIFKGSAVSANSLREFDKLLNSKSSINEIKYIGSRCKLKKNKHIEYHLRIGWGCYGKCSYCAIRFVFGKLHSRPISDIVQEFNIAYSKGYRRFPLIANDTASYGQDLNSSIIHLLDELCKHYKESQFELSYFAPNKLKEMLPALERFISSNKIYSINIPVNSGSNRMLRLMNRLYSVDDFKYCVQKISDYNPSLEILTDILVGFPTETEKDFLDTLRLVEWLGRYNAYFQCISYSNRPNTEASKMSGQVDEETKKKYVERLTKLCNFSYILRDKKLFKRLKRKRIY